MREWLLGLPLEMSQGRHSLQKQKVSDEHRSDAWIFVAIRIPYGFQEQKAYQRVCSFKAPSQGRHSATVSSASVVQSRPHVHRCCALPSHTCRILFQVQLSSSKLAGYICLQMDAVNMKIYKFICLFCLHSLQPAALSVCIQTFMISCISKISEGSSKDRSDILRVQLYDWRCAM